MQWPWSNASASLVSEGLEWQGDWRRRKNPAPWMLCNLVFLLRTRGRENEAREAGLQALSLEPDHTTPCHEIWLALDSALAGDASAALARMNRVGTPELTKYFRCLVLLIEALVAMAAPGQADADTAYRAARKKLSKAGSMELLVPKDRLLRKLRRRAVWAIARKRGGLGAWIWAVTSKIGSSL